MCLSGLHFQPCAGIEPDCNCCLSNKYTYMQLRTPEVTRVNFHLYPTHTHTHTHPARTHTHTHASIHTHISIHTPCTHTRFIHTHTHTNVVIHKHSHTATSE